MSFKGLLNQDGLLYRPTVTADTMGGETSVYTFTATIPCRIMAKSAQERVVAGAHGVAVTHKAFCETDTTIYETDELRIGTDKYQITFVNNVDVMNHHYELDLIQYKPAR